MESGNEASWMPDLSEWNPAAKTNRHPGTQDTADGV